MAKSMSFIDLPTPSSFAGEAIEGGSLAPNTTYYYRLYACFSDSLFSSTINGKSLSPPEISVTTTTTKKSIRLTWNYPTGTAGGYRVFKSTISGRQTVPTALGIRDIDVNSGGFCTFIDSLTTTGGNVVFENRTHGKLTLSGSTVSDVFNITSLYDLDVAGGFGVVHKIDSSLFIIDAAIEGHTGMYWIDESKTIIFYDYLNPTTSGNFKFGYFDAVNNITYNPCHLIFKNPYLYALYFGYLNAYKTTFESLQDFNIYYSSLGYGLISIFFTSGSIIDCQCNKIRGFVPTGSSNCIFTNFLITDFDNAFDRFSGVFNGVRGTKGSRFWGLNVQGQTLRASDLVVQYMTYIFIIYAKNQTITIINTNFTLTANSFYAAVDSSGSIVNQVFTYNLKVMQNDGITPIPGASVKIYDLFDNLICNEITDVNGEIPQKELIYYRSTFGGVGGRERTDIKHAPHKTIIQKNDYQDYIEFTDYAGSFAIDKTVSLSPAVYIDRNIQGSVQAETIQGSVQAETIQGDIN